MLTIYSRPGCMACTMTVRTAEQRGVPYEVKELTPEKAEEFKAEGLLSLPIVVAGDEKWSGFRLSKIVRYVK